MNRILYFAKDEKQIEFNGNVFTSDFESFAKIEANSSNLESIELDVVTKVFCKRGWQCYWTCLNQIDTNKGTVTYYNPIERTYQTINSDHLNTTFDVIIFRIIGSVERQSQFITASLDYLVSIFKGLIVNHPKAIKYAMRKDYLFKLQEAGFPIIQTDYFEKSETFENINANYINSGNYVIKPITGECGNSVSRLSKINETYLREKESKVGGWIVQPVVNDVSNGEYQLVFFGQTFSHACKTTYPNGMQFDVILEKNTGDIDLYTPSDKEIDLAIEIQKFFHENLNVPLYTFRLDFLKTANNEIKIMEVEFLNQDFLISYMKNDYHRFEVAFNFSKAITKILATNGSRRSHSN